MRKFRKLLNLGSGIKPQVGYTNVDRLKIKGVDEVVDLNGPWPWEDESVDFIRAHHILEHIHGPCHPRIPGGIWFMNEAWRVLKLGGTLDLIFPSVKQHTAFTDPTHVSFWNKKTLLYFDINSVESRFYPDVIQSAFDVKAREDSHGMISAFCIKTELPEECRNHGQPRS